MKKKVLNRRDFLRVAAGATAGAVLGGCAPAPTPEVIEKIVKETVEVEKVVTVEVEKEVMPEAQKNAFGYVEWHPDEPVEIVFFAHDINVSSGPGAQDRRTLEAFHRMYPNIKVRSTTADWFGAMTPLEKVAAAFAAGEPPDVIIMHGQSDVCVKNEWAMPVTDELMPAEDIERLGYKPQRFLSAEGDDSITELASLVLADILFCREDMFEEAGITPDDLGDHWEDAVPALQELTKVDSAGDIVQAGFSYRSYAWISWPIQAGSQYFNKETLKYEWADDDAFLYACQFFRDLNQKHNVTSPDIPVSFEAITQGVSAIGLQTSWLVHFAATNFPDLPLRSMKAPSLKPGDMLGWQGLEYSVGLGVNPQNEDPLRKRAAMEFWKFTYYNTANQLDLGYENTSLVTLADQPDYAGMVEGLPETGLSWGQVKAETLYNLSVARADKSRYMDIGRLFNESGVKQIVDAMLFDLAATDRPVEEIVAEYQAQLQADWDENHWYVPGVVG